MRNDAAVRRQAQTILAVAQRVGENGLLDVSVLERTWVGLGRKGNGKADPTLNALAATDKQFLEWAAERLRMGRGDERLVARLLMLAVIDAARAGGIR